MILAQDNFYHPTTSDRPIINGGGGCLFTKTMAQLRDCGWYWGSISPHESQKLLSEKEIGSFLLRDSSDDRYIFTLSVKTNDGVVHVRINQHKGLFSFGSASSSLVNASGTVVELIDTAVKNSSDNRFRYFLHPKAGSYPAENISLLHPLSRFSFVASLKHLSRFEILRYIRADHIDRLPLPNNLKVYLKDPKHIAEVP